MNRYKTIDFKKYSSIKIGQEVDVLVVDELDNISLKDYFLTALIIASKA